MAIAKRNHRILTSILLAVMLLIAIVATHMPATPQVGLQPRYGRASEELLTQGSSQAAIAAVKSIGMTVADMDRSVEFYTQVLSFKKVSDVEVLGREYEQLQGLFGVRLRVVKLQLGNELLELTEYLTPKGKVFPADSRSNDHWFQHLAIVTQDMDKAYQRLRRFKVQHASTS
jgi:catechol 2,3-dioxygenase-like lactoylglutathione lyase family enzyme